MWVTVTVREIRLAPRHHHLHLQAHFQFWFSSPTIATGSNRNTFGWCMETSPSQVFNKSLVVLLLMTLCQFGWIFSLQEVGCILLSNTDIIIFQWHSILEWWSAIIYDSTSWLIFDQENVSHFLKPWYRATRHISWNPPQKRFAVFSNWHQKRKVSNWATLSYTEYISYIDGVLSYWVLPPEL